MVVDPLSIVAAAGIFNAIVALFYRVVQNLRNRDPYYRQNLTIMDRLRNFFSCNRGYGRLPQGVQQDLMTLANRAEEWEVYDHGGGYGYHHGYGGSYAEHSDDDSYW